MGNGITSYVVSSTLFTPASVSPGTHSQSIKNLLSGNKWGGDIGSGVSLTYSFTDYASTFNYAAAGMSELKLMTQTQQLAAQNAMQAWADVANITFSQVSESTTLAGDIRWSATTSWDIATMNAIVDPNTASHGDIWIGANYGGYNDAQKGSYSYDTYLHEMGHVLGLNHPSDSTLLPVAGEDQLKYSLMSYRSFNGDSTSGTYGNTFFPTTPMINDIAAIQYLYGANTAYHAGNNTYSWSDGEKIFETIWDAGGIDTIDASNQSDAVKIYLTPGKWSTIGGTFWNGQQYVHDCLTIAYGALIENAAGSKGNDTIEGNGANNTLIGNAGNDFLSGLAGNDILLGGLGNDTLAGGANNDRLFGGAGNDKLFGSIGNDTLSGGLGSDVFIFNSVLNAKTNVDLITDFDPAADTIRLENAIFTKLTSNGTLNANFFHASADGSAADSNDYILYNTQTGALYYDADGTGAASAIEFAVLGSTTHPTISNADFVVI